jgi:hypothetical protein
MKRHWVIWWLFALLLEVSCAKEYSYEGGPVSLGYLVKDSLGNCSYTTVQGDYKTGIPFTDSNFLQVVVHIGRKGRYNISSNQQNGYSFSASGNLTDTGVAQVKLFASGKPLKAGIDIFTIMYDSSLCQVAVAVADTIPIATMPTNPDHFPLSAGNRWVYDDLTFPGDSIVNTVGNDTLIGSLTYKRLDEYKSFYPATNRRYYTKAQLNYFRYTSVSGFTSALNFSPSLYDDFNFLKENLTTGSTWYSNTYQGRTSLGVEEKVLRYSFTCLDADASLMVNNHLFNHVCKIEMVPEEGDPGSPLIPTGERHTLYYAKGVGLIYQEFFNGVQAHPVLAIRRWAVK